MDSFEKQLETYKKQKANILIPSERIEVLTAYHEPVIDQVKLSPNPEDGDVYPADKKFRISAQGLRKISVTANIIWHPDECKRTDNRSNPDYCSFQAVGGVRKSDGDAIYWKHEYDMNLKFIEKELRLQAKQRLKKAQKENQPWAQRINSEKDKQDYIDFCTERDLITKSKHMLKLCETGAMLRVVRTLLGVKNSYTKEELMKPFVVVRIVVRPDYDDEEVRRLMIGKAVEAVTGVYGKPSFGQPPIDIPPSDYHDVPKSEPPPDPDPPPEPKTEEGPEEPEPDFENADWKSQIKMIENLMVQKGYDKKTLKRPLEEFKEEHLIGFWEKLQSMPDDDVPY